MKFNNGYWMPKPGVSIHGFAQIRHVKHEKTKFSAYIAPFEVVHRGQTLAGPLLTLEISFPRKDILGIKYYHDKTIGQKEPSFLLSYNIQELSYTETEDYHIITSGKIKVSLSKGNFSLEVTYDGKFLTRSNYKQAAYITTNDGAYFRERLDLAVDEYVYGLGERFTPFVKNGQSVDIWNEDGGTSSEIAYKNVPFYISSRGYGVFVNHPENVSFEIATESASRTQFSVAGEELEYYIICGKTPKDAISNYTDLTGKPPLPPAWSFGLWLSTSFTTDYDEKTVNSFIDGMTDRDIPLSVFHYDCFWMKEYEWCSFEWDEDMFPEPSRMLGRLRDKGLKVCCWINPYIGQKSPIFDEAAKEGFLLKRSDGSVWQWDLWQPSMAIVDFTNPKAKKWYESKLVKLLDMGVDCFKTDFGERIPVKDVVWHDKSNPNRMHNYYSFLFNQTVFELLKKKKGEGSAVLFARSATVGCQQFPVHWGGDCEATYHAMAESLRGGLSLALGGFAFWSHDIGGFEHTATADVYKRWIAFGLFSSHSRLHGSTSYRVPWLYDEESVDVLRHFTKLKNSLMPYIFAQAVMATSTGIPLMRPMMLEYPDDMLTHTLDKQYFFGSSLLIAPVFDSSGKTSVYLPDENFYDFFTGEKISGGRVVHKTYDYMTLPVYVKENSLIAIGREDISEYDFSENITIRAYGVTSQSIDLFDRKGNKKATVFAEKKGDELSFNVEGDAPGVKFEIIK